MSNNTSNNGNAPGQQQSKDPRPFDPILTPTKPYGSPVLGEAYVYLRVNGVDKFIWHAKSKAKLTTFSSAAAHQLAKNKDASGQSIRELTCEAGDEVALRRVLHWIETNDLNKPKELTMSILPAEHTTLDLMKVHHAAYTIRVPKQYRDNDVHQAIFDTIIPESWFSVEQFMEIHYWCFYDKAVIMQMRKKCAWRGIMGYLTEEEETKVVRYMIDHGIKDECEEIERKLRAELKRKGVLQG